MVPLILMAVIVAELVLSGLWVPAYFRYGLPVYWMRVEGAELTAETLPRLQQHFKGDGAPSLSFRALDASTIAFRDSWMVWSSYTPTMHGLIRADEKTLYVIGNVNWSVLAFAAFFASHLDTPEGRFMGAVFLLIGAAICFAEVRAYRKVGRFLRGSLGGDPG